MKTYIISYMMALVTLAASAEFRPGDVWLDTDGKPIQAHSAGILCEKGTYYWYGEDKTLGNGNKRGVSCYSSTDLYHWKNRGLALPKDAMPPQFRDDGIVERPKVIFNPLTRRYVMWMHLDDARYQIASAGIATSESPTGPFVFQKQIRPILDDFNYKDDDKTRQKQLGGTFRDMNLFVDDDGKAYVFYASEGNVTMYVVRLNDQFTGPETPTVLGKIWARLFIGKSREAPAPFKFNNRFYLITSGCTGWEPNAITYAVADHILGPWEMKQNPCIGPDANKTFHAQSTFVLPVAGKPGCFVFMADRWFKNKLQDSRYVWLPLTMKPDGTFSLEWHDSWNLSVFGGKGS